MTRCELTEDGQYIAVKTDGWSQGDLIRQVPGFNWKPQLVFPNTDEVGYWRGQVSWAGCQTLRGVFGDRLEVGPHLVEWATRELQERITPANKLRALTELDVEKTDKRLYPFQDVGHRFLGVARYALLADDMGAGKTAQVLMAMREAEIDAASGVAPPGLDALPALVICPNSVKHQWADESLLWKLGATPYVIGGGAAKRRKIFEEAADDPTALIIINIEAVRIHSKLAPYGSVRLRRCVECGGSTDPTVTDIDPLASAVPPSRCEVHPKDLNTIPFRTVIVDEAHRLKDPSSKQTRACWAVGHGSLVNYRYALTGTPIASDIADLWSIMHFLAPHEHPTRGGWIDRFCLLGWNAQGAVEVLGIRPDTRDEFFRIIDPRTRRMPKALVLPQLPPKIYERRDVDLTPKQRKAYDELERSLVTRLEDGRRVVTTNNLTNQVRLLQLASSYFEVVETTLENGEVKRDIRMCDPSPKLDDLMVVDEGDLRGKQYVVCAVSRQLIEMAAERLEKKHPEQVVQITGAVPPGIRQANLAAFQAGRARILLFTIQAGGTGLNMTAADTMVRLQRSWSVLENHQAVDRIHRIGSDIHESILIIDIVAADTVEIDQAARLYVKQARMEELNRDKAKLIEAGNQHAADLIDAEELALLGTNLTGVEELRL